MKTPKKSTSVSIGAVCAVAALLVSPVNAQIREVDVTGGRVAGVAANGIVVAAVSSNNYSGGGQAWVAGNVSDASIPTASVVWWGNGTGQALSGSPCGPQPAVALNNSNTAIIGFRSAHGYELHGGTIDEKNQTINWWSATLTCPCDGNSAPSIALNDQGVVVVAASSGGTLNSSICSRASKTASIRARLCSAEDALASATTSPRTSSLTRSDSARSC